MKLLSLVFSAFFSFSSVLAASEWAQTVAESIFSGTELPLSPLGFNSASHEDALKWLDENKDKTLEEKKKALAPVYFHLNDLKLNLDKTPEITSLNLGSCDLGSWFTRRKVSKTLSSKKNSVQNIFMTAAFLGTKAPKLLEHFNKGKIKTLYLDSNFLGDCKYFEGLLKNNTSLEVLYLRRNNIGQEGLQYILKGLEGNHTLRELHLEGNDISKEMLSSLREDLKIFLSMPESQLLDLA